MIYFAYDEAKSRIKIGKTRRDVHERMRELSRVEKTEIIVLGIHWGSVKDERLIQSAFKPINIEGEWFKDHLLLREYILRACVITVPDNYDEQFEQAFFKAFGQYSPRFED